MAATQITTNMQMSIAEHSTKNMEADGPQQKTTTPGAAPVISEQEIEWHGFTKNWDKTLPGRDESRFVVQHSDGRVRIWHKQNESTDPSCFYIDDSGWWCNCIADVFFFMVNFEPHAVCDHAHPFIMTVYPSSNGYFQQENGLSGILSILHSLHISIQSSTLEMWGNGQKEKKEKKKNGFMSCTIPSCQ